MKTFSSFISEAKERTEIDENLKNHISNVASQVADKLVDVAYDVKKRVNRHNQAFANLPLNQHLKKRSQKASAAAQAE